MNFPGKIKETDNTSNPHLDVFSFFRANSLWFLFLFTINKFNQIVIHIVTIGTILNFNGGNNG